MRAWRAVRNTARAAAKSRRERLSAGGGGIFPSDWLPRVLDGEAH